MTTSFVKAHRILAIGLSLFILIHLIIHLSAINGPETHIKWLTTIQGTYRNWAIEPLLILGIILQVIIGGRLIWRRCKQPQKGFWGWAQIISGVYLAAFLINHSSAALFTRYVVGLDTNFYWAAATLKITPTKLFFAPYYLMGVTSIFAHLGAALYFGRSQKSHLPPALILSLGVIVSVMITATFSGVFYEIQIPSEYTNSYKS